ncbi:hypothetical protein D3C75_755130 [compost metagenome]
MEVRVPVFKKSAHFPVSQGDGLVLCINRSDFVVRPFPAVAEDPVEPDIIRLGPKLRPLIGVGEGASAGLQVSILAGRPRVNNIAHLDCTFVGPSGQGHPFAFDVQLHGRSLADIVGFVVSMTAHDSIIGNAVSHKVHLQNLGSCICADDPVQNRLVRHRGEPFFLQLPATAKPHGFARISLVGDRFVCRPRILLLQQEASGPLIDAAPQINSNAAVRQSCALLQLADGISGFFQGKEGTLLGS